MTNEGRSRTAEASEVRIHRPALIAVLCLGLGIALDAAQQPFSLWSNPTLWNANLFWLVIALASQWSRPVAWRSISILLFLVLLGALRHHQTIDALQSQTIRNYATELGAPVRIQGTVVTGVEIDEAETGPRIPSWLEVDSSVCHLRCEQLDDRGQWLPVTGIVRLRVSGHLTSVYAGDVITVFGELKLPAPVANPGGYDFTQYLNSEGVSALLMASHPAAVVVTQTPTAGYWSLSRAREAIRSHCRNLFTQSLSFDSQALAASLLIGDRTLLTKSQRESFQQSGAMHILAISGMHVSILAAFVAMLARLGNLSSRATAVSIFVVCLFYAGLTNQQPPVLRATLTICLVLFGSMWNRRVDLLNALACCAMILLLFRPLDLFDLGAQLSFLAVLAILWCLDLLSRFPRPNPQAGLPVAEQWQWLDRLRPFGNWLVQAMFVTVVIWFVTFPLIASRFHIVSPVGLLLNLVLVPVSGLVLWQGYLFLIVGWLAPFLLMPIGALFDFTLKWFQWAVDFARNLPGGYFGWSGFPDWWLLVFYLLIATCVASSRYLTIQKWLCITLCGWCALIVGMTAFPTRDNELRMTVLSVGHGLAIVIEFPNGETLLYDAGNSGNGARAEHAVEDYLWSRNKNRIDAVIVSHADHDHFSGLFGVIDRIPIGKLFVNQQFLDFDQRGVFDLCEMASARQIPIELLHAGDRLQIDRSSPTTDVRMEILHPAVDFASQSDNAQSLVLAIAFHDRSILLTGDVEHDGLQALLSRPVSRYDVLLSPHHGSARSNPEELLTWASPEILIISTSDREVGPRLRSELPRNVEVLSTADSGAVTVLIDRSGAIKTTSFRSLSLDQ